MAEIYQLPENGNNGNATIPFSIPIGFGGSSAGVDYLKKQLDEKDVEDVVVENAQ